MKTVPLTRSAGSALNPIALSMLLVSLAVSLTLAAVKAPVLDTSWVPVMAVLTLAAAAWRVWLMVRHPPFASAGLASGSGSWPGVCWS